MAAILGPLISDKKLNFEQYLLNTHWHYTLQIHGITTVDRNLSATPRILHRHCESLANTLVCTSQLNYNHRH